jgi:hypothetical protein
VHGLRHKVLGGSFRDMSGLDLFDLLNLGMRKLGVPGYDLLDLRLGLFDRSAVAELTGRDGIKPVGRGCLGRLIFGGLSRLNFGGLNFRNDSRLITLYWLFDDRWGRGYRKRLRRRCLFAATVAREGLAGKHEAAIPPSRDLKGWRRGRGSDRRWCLRGRYWLITTGAVLRQ